VYEHSVYGGTTVLRSAQHYSLPESVARHVDFVAPVNRFPAVRKTASSNSNTTAAAQGQNTPVSLRKLYEVGTVEGKASSNKLACTAFLQQYYRPSDLAKFYKKYYPSAKGKVIKVVGPDSGYPGIEASLDIEFISTMGAGVEAEFWSFAGHAPDNSQNEPFLDWMYLIGNTTDEAVPKVFSTSYGEAEYTVSSAYMQRIEIEFQKAGARGITLLFASGDSGVADDDGGCQNGRFAGQWPAGSPWVTGVGGTEGFAPEGAWAGSSGGFSDRWPLPDFQKDAVTGYLQNTNGLPDASHFNATGRGFPDVSAQSTNFLVVNGGITQNVAGTSCACPTFSGVFALLNDLRLQANKTTLGWANPLFYQNPGMFTDITQGQNEAGGSCGNEGFKATKGWDAVTGLGTPNYVAMAKVVAALP